jgi:precorrin isomerase
MTIQETPIMKLCHVVHHACADIEYSLKLAAVAHGVQKDSHAVARALEIYNATHMINGAVKRYCREVGDNGNIEGQNKKA